MSILLLRFSLRIQEFTNFQNQMNKWKERALQEKWISSQLILLKAGKINTSELVIKIIIIASNMKLKFPTLINSLFNIPKRSLMSNLLFNTDSSTLEYLWGRVKWIQNISHGGKQFWHIECDIPAWIARTRKKLEIVCSEWYCTNKFLLL